MIVLDSSVLVAHLRGNERAIELLKEERDRGTLLVPALAAWELWRGAKTAEHRQGVGDLLETAQIDALSAGVAHLAGELDRDLREEGDAMPTYDLLIASHALFHDVPLATLDRDYRGIEDLTVVEP